MLKSKKSIPLDLDLNADLAGSRRKNEYGFTRIRILTEEPCTHPLADVLGLFAESLGVGDRVVSDSSEQLLLVLTLRG